MIPDISPKLKNGNKLLNQIYNNLTQKNSFSDEAIEIYTIILELLKNYKLFTLINEIKYRAGNDEDLNDIFIGAIKNNRDLPFEVTSYLTALYDIENLNWVNKFS